MRPMHDAHAMTDLTEDVDTHLTEQQKSAVRRLVAGLAQGDTLADQVADATELMHMLGVHPDDPDEEGVAPYRPHPTSALYSR